MSLLRHALWASAAVGVFLPVIGAWFLVRRMTLTGLALPQVSAAGIAFVFFLQGLGLLHAGDHSDEHHHGDRLVALGAAVVFTWAAAALLAALERRPDGMRESRLGAMYASAAAAAVLLVSANPGGRIELLGLLHGDVVAVTASDFRLMLGVFAVLAAAMAAMHRPLLETSFDRESAIVAGRRPGAWELAFYLVAGAALAMSVLIAGPGMSFAFLVIPPLAVRPLCRRMPGFLLASAALGGAAALGGFFLSYRMDWPLGPSNVAVASGLLLLARAYGLVGHNSYRA